MHVRQSRVTMLILFAWYIVMRSVVCSAYSTNLNKNFEACDDYVTL